ncbi:recombination protein RecR [Patescibacteria group bacterium]|nr:recombination protein RecR [Patescibacteria group bacterium]
MKVPKPILRLIESFERLPGIGPKTAQRLTFHLLHFPQEDLQRFADSLVGLKTGTKLCSICKNVSETDICSVCSDSKRDERQIIVVSNPLDVFAIEKTNFSGVYHVLHGTIDPLNHVGPEELFIKELKQRLEDLFTQSSKPVEIILGTNTSLEGESTAMYISRLLRDLGYNEDKVVITRIARGLPVGGDIEYADDITLKRALEGRANY